MQKVDANSSSSSDDELMDDQGKVIMDCQEYLETLDNFQQERFVFLFDDALKFKQRKELSIRPEDFQKMIKLNREALINFLQELLEGKLKPEVSAEKGSGEYSMESIDITASTKFPINDRKSFVTGEVSDKEIEENFKSILSEKKNGEFMDSDIVAHLEYFHNTLGMQHKNHPHHENPFNCIENYPALTYIAPMKDDLESIQESLTEEQSDFDGIVDRESMNESSKINPQILISSPTKDELNLNQYLQNKTPEQNKARKCSIRMEIKNQSKNFVRRLSVFDRHNLLINPIKFQKELFESVKNDKSSILSSSSDFSSAKKESLIDSKKYQSRLVKNSMIEIMGGDRWNPNANIDREAVYKFNGSPPPKRGSIMATPIKGAQKQRGSVLFNLQPVDCQNSSSAKPDPTRAVIDQIAEMSLETQDNGMNLSARIQKMQKANPVIDQEMDDGYDSTCDFGV